MDGFAGADGWDETSGRYRGLMVRGSLPAVTPSTLVLRPEAAPAQTGREKKAEEDAAGSQAFGKTQTLRAPDSSRAEEYPRAPAAMPQVQQNRCF